MNRQGRVNNGWSKNNGIQLTGSPALTSAASCCAGSVRALFFEPQNARDSQDDERGAHFFFGAFFALAGSFLGSFLGSLRGSFLASGFA